MIKTKLAKSHTNNKIPAWPKERDLSRYSNYTEIDFGKDLSEGKTWIDIGCRTGKALSQTRKFYDANLIGINAHNIRVRKGIKSILACIPEEPLVYKQYRKKAHLVTDIHGAVSYCENPLEALIYESYLLKPNAKAVIVTMESRLGGRIIWKRIQQFFEKFMQQSIEFKKFTTYTNTTKTPIKTLRITIHGDCKFKRELDDLFLEAHKHVGAMKKRKIIAEPVDKSFQIWGVTYTKKVKICPPLDNCNTLF